jgi:hypothetical protein
MDGIFLANVMIDKLEKDLPKVPLIEKRFAETIQKYGIHSKGQGLFQEIWNPASEQDLYECDLLVTLRSKNSIKVLLPIIADDEYFEFLDTAMAKLVSLK